MSAEPIRSAPMEMQGLEDIKALRDPSFPWMDALLVALVLLLLALGIAWIVRRLRRDSSGLSDGVQEQNIPERHWTEELWQVLARLQTLPLEEEGLRAGYFDLAFVVRRLLEVNTGQGATEMTAFEIKRLVAPRLGPERAEQVSHFFQRSEAIQFAKASPVALWKRDLEWALGYFEKVRASEQSPVPQAEKGPSEKRTPTSGPRGVSP